MGELNRRPDVAAAPTTEPPARAKPGRPTDQDVQAELARLMGHKPTPDRPRPSDVSARGGAEQPADKNAFSKPDARPELDARLEEAQSKIAELRSRLEERDAKLDAADAKIADLENRLETAKSEFDGKVGTLERRFEALLDRQERRISDLESRASGQPDRPEARAPEMRRSAEDSPEQGRVAQPVMDEQARNKRADEPPSKRRGPSDAALGFMVSGAGTALSEVASLMPPAAHAATLTAGILGMGVSGVAWVRQRRRARNADRSEG